jgi:hypothetical protein
VCEKLVRQLKFFHFLDCKAKTEPLPRVNQTPMDFGIQFLQTAQSQSDPSVEWGRGILFSAVMSNK